VTLTFTVDTTSSLGTYCSAARVKPAENESKTGQTAAVQIGSDPGVCTGETVAVSLVVDSANLVLPTDINSSPYIYTFDIDFTLTINNTGSDTIELHDIEILLPPGFSTLVILSSGDITDGLKSGTPEWEASVGRFNYEWDWNPKLFINAGASQTIKYSTVAAITNGTYWSDVVVDIH